MENRRLFCLKRDPALGSSTLIPPQLEQHTLFLKPLVTKKLRDEYKEKTGEDFGIVVNVGNAEPSDIKILYGEGDVVEIKIEQPPTPFNGMTFARTCHYRYELPENIDKTTLKALKTLDNYLVILPDFLLREGWENCTLAERYSNFYERVVESPSPSPLKVPTLPHKERVQKTAEESPQAEPMVVEQPSVSSEQSELEVVEQPQAISEDELRRRREESDKICPPGSQLEVTEMDRFIRPSIDLLVLRNNLLNIERYVYRLRKFVENSSFIVEDKLTVEQVIYHSARQSKRYHHGESVLA
ncbi:uncharacterized protein TNIN_467211 [Trichonephila inaurata madagascariensis]|uniref:Uncharacterized protein n=1 Tax=Trichonephila inaurata madagascariensis TaxID=2747483 RepID=A0A8X7CE34_9ARAC|nr:uncharacterized protein TNIN_467211 [Trichonephila inaurata madagascariensis]